jgi:hypothetical protein
MTITAASPGSVRDSPDPANLRDLGGFDTGAGRVRVGVALRSDDLSSMSEGYADELVERGLRTLIDLRSHAETAVTGRGPLGTRDLTYHHVPLLDAAASPAHLAERFGPMTPDQVGAWYVEVVESAAPRLALCLQIIAASDGATAFHCSAGKDRTGIVAALVLSAVGASSGHIVADYALTGANLPLVDTRLRRILGAGAADGSRHGTAETNALMGAVPASMSAMLEILTDRYGDALAPLYAAGLDVAVVDRLRRRMIDAAPR